jgi:hypothetical protein
LEEYEGEKGVRLYAGAILFDVLFIAAELRCYEQGQATGSSVAAFYSFTMQVIVKGSLFTGSFADAGKFAGGELG